MTPRELLNAIRLRAYALTFASEGKVSFEAAKKQATREITSEERQRKRALQHSPIAGDAVTVSTARATLLAKLAGIAERLKATAYIEQSAPSPPTIRKRTRASPTPKEVGDVPSAPINNEPEPLTGQIIGIFGAPSTSERIDDREFAPSLRWGDTATDNWRRSIERNKQIQRRDGRWIG
jgi:hypothetical protein